MDLPADQQRSVPRGIRKVPGRVRRGGSRGFRRVGSRRGDPCKEEVLDRRPVDRSRREAVHDAGTIRRGLRRAFQVQPKAHRGSRKRLGIHEGYLPDGRDKADGEHGTHHKALPDESQVYQSVRDRRNRTGAGFRSAASQGETVGEVAR